ncbi:tyrosine-protein phosphatase 10D-like [Dreissena polymorpha]|nr:tyrosine-protein phosphatase 10D-like [Dreissena polymorpha]
MDDLEVITVQVRAETNAGLGPYEEKMVTVYPGAPEVPAETSDNPLTRKSDIRVDDSKEMLAVELPKSFLCNNTNGKAVQWGVIVAEESKATDPSFIGSIGEYWKRKDTLYKKWSDIKDEDVIPPYVTTGPTWKPICGLETHRLRRAEVEKGKTLTYIVGNEDCSNSNGYCNGPLKPGRSYRVKSYACTTTGCTETLYSFPMQTAPDRTGAIVGGFLAALFAIAILAVVIYARRKQKLCFKRRAFKPNKMAEDMEFDAIGNPTSEYVFGPGLVKLSDFLLHVEKMHRDINLLFNKAYKMLVERSPCYPASVAESDGCMPKNRYINILPYDRSRVKLKPLDEKEGSDYINANYIPGYTLRREYIATQGPLSVTIDDFWRMIWEENVDTIVMLTQLMEQDRVKCDMYWPASKTPVAYGTLLVSVHSEEKLEQYMLRIFEVKHNEERRLVNHFQYLEWPDMGCPEDPQMLLDFVADVRECTNKPGGKSPIVVHCSAGVGRTGTFIAVDHLLQHIRDHDEIDIFQVVLEMREHRCQMVQTEDQFVYIHDVLKEFIINDDEDDEEVDDEHCYQNENFATGESDEEGGQED